MSRVNLPSGVVSPTAGFELVRLLGHAASVADLHSAADMFRLRQFARFFLAQDEFCVDEFSVQRFDFGRILRCNRLQ